MEQVEDSVNWGGYKNDPYGSGKCELVHNILKIALVYVAQDYMCPVLSLK